MKILLVAYEFPPGLSPQSLRWAYLVRELDRLGHEIHVLAPDISGSGPGGLPELPASVHVHRCFAGPLMGFAASRARGPRSPGDGTPAPESLAASVAPGASGLNWKGRIYDWAKRLVGLVVYPDVRGEWAPWARRRLHALLDELRPDLVVSSHEPATTLQVGRLAKRRGFAWIADLGDPVLAPYTERRWRRRALALERQVCDEADLVIVTAEGARELMAERHGLPASRSLVLTQGFDDRREDAGLALQPGDRLDLLYAGSFYAFRRPDCLIDAIAASEGVRLMVASANTPVAFVKAARRHPDKFLLLGFLSHEQILRMQRRAHVLINISNDSPVQIPGKVYEYLGAGRPILHLRGDVQDAAGALLAETGRGLFCANDATAIATALAELRADLVAGRLCARFELGRGKVAHFGWSRLARRAADAFESVLEGRMVAAPQHPRREGLFPTAAINTGRINNDE